MYMKKIIWFLCKIIFFVIFLISIQAIFAAEDCDTEFGCKWDYDKAVAAQAASKSTVYVTEKIPGANCVPAEWSVESDITKRKYKCTIEAGFWSFQRSIQGITGWFTQIALILSVLVVVLLGIAWAIWGSSEEKVKFLKWWTINILIGIVTLFFFQYILVMLAPWVFK